MATEKIDHPARKGDWCVEMRHDLHAFRDGRDIGTGIYQNNAGITYEWVDTWHCVRVAAAFHNGIVMLVDVPGALSWEPYSVMTLSPKYQRAAESLVGQAFPDTESLKAALQAAVNA